jgi:hypothetical protein
MSYEKVRDLTLSRITACAEKRVMQFVNWKNTRFSN